MGAAERVAAAEPVTATLGRYRLERELGAGAMGVVHAAFDPNLERRIALKVLRGTATFDARDRLLREARAMARLAHPNVVTVYEVSFADGRDFVAMELIHGETLAEWLREVRRTPAAILDAFLAAGRGLAAAHAAGIVHRDFKPHNVLRSRAGRIVVTDFGLAREAASQEPALDATLVGTGSSAASALSGITVTGSLLGTPAYMAPEQWQGGAITPATDQFAFCVALWEALSGQRPYRGPTFDDLKRQVARGPAALDASRIPRRVRGLLRRGLDPDPAKRWPSMDALLERLRRARRRPGVAAAIAGGAVVAAVVAFLALRPDAAPGCEPPAREVAAVWSPVIDAALRVQTSPAHAAVLAAAHRDWQRARTEACTAQPQVRPAQLACLDGVAARFDALRQAFVRTPAVPAEELQAQLPDPAICNKPVAADVPRLALAPAPDVIAALAVYARSQTEHKPTDAEIATLTDAPRVDPCARVIATLAFEDASRDVPRVRPLMNNATSVVDQCGDDRLRADLLIRSVKYQREQPIVGPKGAAALRHAEVAASRVMQPDLGAAIAGQRRAALRVHGSRDEMLRLLDIEIAGYGARGLAVRQLQAVIARNDVRLARRTPRDLEAVAADLPAWRPIALANHRNDLVWQLDFAEASARFARGDVAGAHPELMRLWQTRPPGRMLAGQRIEGDVVDDRGRPAAGAGVWAAFSLSADSIGVGVPHEDLSLRTTTTDAAGHFVLPDAAAVGAIVAQLGERRSPPVAIAERVQLVLAPTRRIAGKVALDGTPATQVTVFAEQDGATVRFQTIAPVAADGAFSLSGAPLGALRVGVSVRDDTDVRSQYEAVVPASRAAGDLALTAAQPTRSLDVVVRSAIAAPLEGAGVFVVYGKPQVRTVGELMRLPSLGGQERLATPVTDDRIPGPLARTVRHGDLLARFEHLGAGPLTVCTVSFPGDMLDPVIQQRMMAHVAELAVTCKLLEPDAVLAVLAVAPQARLE
ncbi:MAG: serine/threonine protein kinase [Deltaproteobacteria bacterium]|nr:MAG: serine/threonine protein kinase [Deltaproteobacteria bacterium]